MISKRIRLSGVAVLTLASCTDLPDFDDPRESEESATAQPRCKDLLTNGDFDDGPNSWGPGSSEVIKDEYDYSQSDIYAHSGDHFAWLGGTLGATRTIEQVIDVPYRASGLRLKGKAIVGSEAETGPVEDTLKLEVLDRTSGAVLETPLSWSNQDPTEGTSWSWRDFRTDIVGDYAGQSIRLRLRSVTNQTNNTNFVFDSLSLKPISCR